MECKKEKVRKEKECDCERCRRQDMVICMFFVVFGFMLTVMGSMMYIVNYKPFVGVMTISDMLSSTNFSYLMAGAVGLIGSAAFSFGLFYLIINARKYEGIDL